MNILFVLVPIALMLAGAGVIAFRWAVQSGQYNDLESPAIRLLIDDQNSETGLDQNSDSRTTNDVTKPLPS